MTPRRREARLRHRLAGERGDDAIPRRDQRARDHRDDQRQRARENQGRYDRHDQCSFFVPIAPYVPLMFPLSTLDLRRRFD